MTDHYKKSQNKDRSANKKEPLEQEDGALWDAVIQDITPLKNKNVVYQNKPKHSYSSKDSDKDSVQNISKNETTADQVYKASLDLQDFSLGMDVHTDNGITIETVPVGIPEKLADVDKQTRRRLRRGQIPIDGCLDLHGMTQQQAQQALLGYIPSAYNADKRCILIVTGKGQPRHGNLDLLERIEHVGVLKQKTPQWLCMVPLSSYILDIQPARPNHGGEGALYVLLRRKRP